MSRNADEHENQGENQGENPRENQPRNHRKIVFDFGAVVFHWNPAAMLMRELPQQAHDAASAARWVAQIFQGYGGEWGEFDRGMVGVPDLVRRLSARTGLPAHAVQTVVAGVARELRPQDDTVALLRELHGRGRALYYLSNMPAPLADELEARHDFLRCFQDGVFSGRVQLAKPDVAIYELAAQRFGAQPQELVFIDDHPPNIAAAQALGWDGFVFTSAAQARAELAARGLV